MKGLMLRKGDDVAFFIKSREEMGFKDRPRLRVTYLLATSGRGMLVYVTWGPPNNISLSLSLSVCVSLGAILKLNDYVDYFN